MIERMAKIVKTNRNMVYVSVKPTLYFRVQILKIKLQSLVDVSLAELTACQILKEIETDTDRYLKIKVNQN